MKRNENKLCLGKTIARAPALSPLHRILSIQSLSTHHKMDPATSLDRRDSPSVPNSTSVRNSTSSDPTLTEQQRISLAYPSAPPPNGNPRDVQEFLQQYFLVNRTDMNQSEAEAEAKQLAAKLRIRGEGLYCLSETSLTGQFGPEGQLLYNIIQSARSGYVCQNS